MQNPEAVYKAEKTKSCILVSTPISRFNPRVTSQLLTLLVAAMAMLSSWGCQLM